jgi:hypothetical protein
LPPSAVETHINFANPADERWLISPRTDALSRIILQIRDVAKRKLTEDTRSRPGKKKQEAKENDVVVGGSAFPCLLFAVGVMLIKSRGFRSLRLPHEYRATPYRASQDESFDAEETTRVEFEQDDGCGRQCCYTAAGCDKRGERGDA